MLLTTPEAAELSVWLGECGCFQPISPRVFRCDTMACTVINIAPISDSDVDTMTNFMICAIVSTGPLHFGIGASSARKRCDPALLIPRLSLWNPSSE